MSGCCSDPYLKDFFSPSYSELAEMNLSFKTDRASFKTPEYFQKKAHQILKSEPRIKAVTVCFADIEGKFLMLDYNKDFLLSSEDNLTFDGSSIRGFTAQNESDLRLSIDWSSFRFLPSDIFGAGKVLVFTNVCDKDGSPYGSSFRGILQELANDLYQKNKMVINVSPEIEGILLEGKNAEQRFNEDTGVTLATYGGYYNTLPQDKLRQFINLVAEAKHSMGFENEKNHPEVAPAQFELNYRYTDIVQAADNILLYKLICRQVAKTLGFTASFLPKPKMNVNGNGMHTNISISQNNTNIFYDPKGINNLSQNGHDFLNSILYYAKDICLILSSSVNAYRRLDPAFEAPNEIKVSPNDRGSMIRIPLDNKNSARIEVRSVAPDCNPYLELYTLLQTGLKGMQGDSKNKKKFASVHQKREKLPTNIYDALRYFKRSDFIRDILGKENQQKFATLKESTANRCPRELGTRVKSGEILFHHEITNQYIWSKF